jgi:hypothetical protein
MSLSKPSLRIRQLPDYYHRWSFLDYSTANGEEYKHWNDRWWLEVRDDLEGFILICGFQFTFIGNNGDTRMIADEMALVPHAIQMIKSVMYGR